MCKQISGQDKTTLQKARFTGRAFYIHLYNYSSVSWPPNIAIISIPISVTL
jgi:hypothetical protein